MSLLRLCLKISTVIAGILILYTEVISYYLLQFQWIQQPICNIPECYKLLLIADPQILGSQSSGEPILNIIARWDSDRYIKKTFLQAFDYIRPDFLIFLGDSMDAGHISSNKDFLFDLKRFLDIFQLLDLNQETKTIIVPGDNDIGGEDDILLPDIVRRFDKFFNQSTGPVLLERLEFYKVNSLIHTYQNPEYLSYDFDIVRVALSHIPLLPRASPFINVVVKKIKPHVIFSGHVHKSYHAAASESNIWKLGFSAIGPNESETKVFNLRPGLVHEIVVPTCSYRMGEKEMGYGAAFIDVQNKLLYYNVLWLPTRFGHLYAYIAVIVFFLVLFIIIILICLLYRIRRLLKRIYSKTVASKFYSIP